MTLDDTASIDAARRDAGASLQFLWQASEHDTREDLAEDEAEVRQAYAAIQEAAPDDPATATCLTVLALGTLRAHLNGEYGPEDYLEAEDNLPDELDDDDEVSRELAGEVVRAARRALDRQPADNLAAFALGCALEWLGDDKAATAAYRKALRLDPHDNIARARIEELADVELPEPPSAIRSRHPWGFHLLEMTHLVGHSGSTRGWVWLLNDAAEVREAADGYLADWLKDSGHTLEEDFGLWTHVPGARDQAVELSDALQRSPDGPPRIDWSKVPLPTLGGDRLPAGQPIRWLGRFHLFGGTEHDDL